MSKNNCPLEHTVAVHVNNYLDWLKVPHTHVPNEAKRSPQNAAYLKAEGMSPGFPDVIICRACRGYHGMYLELKREKGGKVSPAQEQWLHTLTDEGYYCVVARGEKIAKQEIDWYLGRIEDGRKKNVCKDYCVK